MHDAVHRLLRRSAQTNPSWPEWESLVEFLRATDAERRDRDDSADLCVGELTFAGFEETVELPDWVPGYVSCLRGMSGSAFPDVDGFALALSVVSSNPASMMFGEPVPDPVEVEWAMREKADSFPFQRTESGRLAHLDRELRVLWPDSRSGELVPIATLDDFARSAIREALAGRAWVAAFPDLESRTLDDE